MHTKKVGIKALALLAILVFFTTTALWAQDTCESSFLGDDNPNTQEMLASVDLEEEDLVRIEVSADCIGFCAQLYPNALDILPEVYCRSRCARCEEMGVEPCTVPSSIPGQPPTVRCNCGGECCPTNKKCCRMESGDFCCDLLDTCCEGGCAPFLAECCGASYCPFLKRCCMGESYGFCCDFPQEKCCKGEKGVSCCGYINECCEGECCGLGEKCCENISENEKECCAPDHCTLVDGCCDDTETSCNGVECCSPDEDCIILGGGGGGMCCPQGQTRCGENLVCCPPDKCNNGTCEKCPPGQAPCGRNDCCPPDQCEDGRCQDQGCSPSLKLCGDTCCPADSCSNDICQCPADRICPGSGCCLPNETCRSAGELSKCCRSQTKICTATIGGGNYLWCAPPANECCIKGINQFGKLMSCSPGTYCCMSDSWYVTCCDNDTGEPTYP